MAKEEKGVSANLSSPKEVRKAEEWIQLQKALLGIKSTSSKQEEPNGNNNKVKKRVRERLAYIFGGGFVGYMFIRFVAGVILQVPLPDWITSDMTHFSLLTGVILAFFFGGEYGGSKPDG